MYPPLPLFVAVREVDYDAATDRLSLSEGMPWLSVKTKTRSGFPLFTTAAAAREFVRSVNVRAAIVRADAARLLDILAIARPEAVVFDPTMTQKATNSYETDSVVDWLAGEAPRG